MATTLRDEVRKLWTEAFPADSPQWVESYFSRVYRDEDAMVGRLDGQVVTSLMMHSYRFREAGGADIGMAYISGAATRKNRRGRGYMSSLMNDSLIHARERGDSVVSLIPAHDWLYPFYERFGFATVFYVRADRFTSAHRFTTEAVYDDHDDIYAPEVYEAFSRLEKMQPGWRVMHTKRDFLNILDDQRLDLEAGAGIAVERLTGCIAGIAFGSVHDGCVVVTDAMGETEDARTGALQKLRERFPGKPFKVLTPAPQEEASGGRRGIFPRAMLRIVNVESLLSALARQNPTWRCILRVSDPVVKGNNAIFVVGGGECKVSDSETKVDYNVDVTLLARMLFSSKPMGELLGLPSGRPHMSLMLDF